MLKQDFKQADYRKISVSLIATVLNEASNIEKLLESYQKQKISASEFIIVDAGSNDETAQVIKEFAKKHPNLNINLLIKPNLNRSQARNMAANRSKGEYLAFCDAGCILDESWLLELFREQQSSNKQIVGGFFEGHIKNNFQEAIVPYFLQKSKNLSEKNFMPTTRSLLISKNLYESVGGLNEKLYLSEDYDLMLRLKNTSIPFAFAPKAIVYWIPPENYREFLKKIINFAKSDIEAGIVRPKVLSIFARYLLLLTFLMWNPNLFLAIFTAYLFWSIAKNYHNCPNSWYYLPLLQVSTDVAIMTSSFLALRNFKSRVA